MKQGLFIILVALFVFTGCDDESAPMLDRPAVAIADDPALEAATNEAMNIARAMFAAADVHTDYVSDIYISYDATHEFCLDAENGLGCFPVSATFPTGRRIIIHPSHPLREAVLHEVLHALLAQNGFRPVFNTNKFTDTHPPIFRGVNINWPLNPNL